MNTRVRDLLIARARSARPAGWATAGFLDRPVSRREFLGTGSSLGAAVYGSSTDGRPRLFENGRFLTLVFDGQIWTFDPRAFGRRARLQVNESHEEITVKLSKVHFPGTDLRADFTARFLRRGSHWLVQWVMPSLGFRARAELGGWISGMRSLDGPVRTGTFSGASHLHLGCSVRLRVDPSGRFVFRSDAGDLEWQGILAGRAAEIALEPASTASLLGERITRGGSPVTRFEIAGLEPFVRGVPLGDVPTGQRVWATTRGPVSVSGEFTLNRGELRESVVVESSMRIGYGKAEAGPGLLNLEKGVVFAEDGAVRSIAGRVSRVPHAISSGPCQFLVAGDDDLPLYLEVRGNQIEGPEIDVRLHDAWIPIPGADVGSVRFSSKHVRLDLGSHRRNEVGGGRIFLGDGPLAVLPMGGGRLQLRRGVDLMNLGFEFHGFDLRVARGTPVLVRRPASDDSANAHMRVVLPPQHVAEDLLGGLPPSCEELLRSGRQSGRKWPPDACNTRVVNSRGRLSAPTRVVFDLSSSEGWDARELTAEALTDWGNLGLLVNARAGLEVDASLNDQLGRPGITPHDTVDEARSLLRSQVAPPGPSETALVLASRLVFSPSARARFVASSSPAASGSVPLWSARMGSAGGDTLRAIWSSYLQPGDFKESGIAQGDIDLPIAPRQHRDLVLQTSVFGLPALVTDTPKPGERKRHAQVLAASLHPVYQEFAGELGLSPKELGVAVPHPFENADITLTPFGANFRGRWVGEPPRIRGLNETPSTVLGFNLERLDYWSQHGRDIRVEAVDKGFMMPLGIRASLVTLTERRILPHERHAYPVAKLVKRRFIVFSKPEKAFHGFYRPHEGRDFPVSKLGMLTLQTPDLISKDPCTTREPSPTVEVDPDGSVSLPGGKNYDGILWPRYQDESGATRDVEFAWKADTGQGIVRGHLLFVPNQVVGDPEAVGMLVRYYRSLSGDHEYLRRARLDGSLWRYADARKDGETSFDTHRWLLSARGHLDAANNERFSIDAAMESRGQPPFYPFVAEADIAIQSLDRLAGSPVGGVTVGYTPRFVESGFDSSRNPTEIFLNVVRPEVALDVSSKGQRAGGIAKPNALVVGLSRRIGLVGGRKSPARVGSAAAPESAAPFTSQASAPSPGVSTSFSLDSALAGRFDPAEYFGGLGSAKLLGLISLADILQVVSISAAPQLLEEIEYGPLGADLETAREALWERVTALSGRLNTAITSLQDPVTLRELYPDLYRTAIRVRGVLNATADRLASAQDIAEVMASTGTLYPEVKRTIAEVERTIENPVPAVVSEFVQDLELAWSNMQGVFEGDGLRNLVGELADELLESAFEELCERIEDAGLFGELFGTGEGFSDESGWLGPGDCAAILDAPSAALRAAQKTLLADKIARPWLDLLVRVRALRSGITDDLRSLRRELELRLGDVVLRARVDLSASLRERTSEELRAWADLAAAALTAHLFDERPESAPARSGAIGSRIDDRLRAAEVAIQGALDRLRTESAIDEAVADPALRVNAAPGRNARQVEREFRARVASEVRRAVDEFLGSEIEPILLYVRELRDLAEDRLLDHVLDTARAALDAYLETLELASLARSVVGTACTSSGAPYRAVRDLARLAAPEEAESAVRRLVDAARNATLPLGLAAGPDRTRIDARLASLRTSLAQTEAIVREGAAARAALDRLAARPSTPDLCDSPTLFLRPLRALVGSRSRLLRLLRGVAEQVEALGREVESLAGRAKLPAAVDTIERSLRETVLRATSLATIEADLLRSLEPLKPVLGTRRVEGVIEVVNGADELARRLSQGVDRTRVVEVVDSAERMVSEVDRLFAAEVAQLLVFSKQIADQIFADASGWLRDAGRVFAPLYADILTPLYAIETLLDTIPLRHFVNPDMRAALARALDALKAEKQAWDSMEEWPAESARELVDLLTEREPAIIMALRTVRELFQALLKGRLIGFDIGTVLAELKESAEELLRELVPATIRLSYDWQTALAPFPAPGPSAIFSMVESVGDDLTLEARTEIKPLSREVSSRARGRLRPFRIHLLGSLLDIATIEFEEASFESVDGAAPRFRAKVSSVKTGTLLEFLKPLQAWLSPSGGGFFVRPSLNPPGIEAGYGFAADVISLGALSFMNVALNVSARLPFGDEPATFRFSFASRERPFIISAPPYGGGGYLAFVANAGRIVQFELSLVFGAAVGIRFGPFSGQGRVVAGIYVVQSGDRRCVGGFVQAAAEGNIGCFSLGLCVTVGVRPENPDCSGNRLRGVATYEVHFSIGWGLKITYRFETGYTISNGASGLQPNGDSMRTGEEPVLGGVRVDGPSKFHDWPSYSKRVSTHLVLDD